MMSDKPSNRDWLFVRTRSWRVYCLMCPFTKAVFYVSITNRPVLERLNQHRADRGSAVWDLIQAIEKEYVGETAFCEFALIQSEAAARHLLCFIHNGHDA